MITLHPLSCLLFPVSSSSVSPSHRISTVAQIRLDPSACFPLFLKNHIILCYLRKCLYKYIIHSEYISPYASLLSLFSSFPLNSLSPPPFFFWDILLQHIPGWPGALWAEQAGPELTVMLQIRAILLGFYLYSPILSPSDCSNVTQIPSLNTIATSNPSLSNVQDYSKLNHPFFSSYFVLFILLKNWSFENFMHCIMIVYPRPFLDPPPHPRVYPACVLFPFQLHRVPFVLRVHHLLERGTYLPTVDLLHPFQTPSPAAIT